MRRINKFILPLLCLFVSLNAQATVTAVSSTGTTKNVLLGRSTPISTGWSVTDSTFAAGSTTVSSARGRYCLAAGCAVVLGINSRRLSQTYVSPGGFAGPHVETLSLTETVVVPSAVIHRAHKNGVTSFVYERSFVSTEGGGASLSASTNLRITSAGGVGFFVTRVALKFDDGAPLKVVDQGDSVSVQAEVSFNGTGLIRGVWEVADPATTAGTPVFRPLRTVRQYLIAGDAKTLVSPGLPTHRTGLYLVRLRLTELELGFTLPEIRYFVSGRRPAAVPPPAHIGLVKPAPSALLKPRQLFQWSAVKGSQAYQLEIYADAGPAIENSLPDLRGGSELAKPRVPAGQRPVTGLVVSGKKTKTGLSPVSRRHLQPKQRYVWRVLAIDGQGAVIGESDFRRIRIP